MSYVCSPLSCVCVFCVLFFIYVSVCVCSCSFAGGCVWLYWRMCVSYVYASCVSCISLLSVFLCLVCFCSPGCLCVLGFCVFVLVFGVLGGCLWGVFLGFWRVSGVLFCWGGGFLGQFLFCVCGSIVCFVFGVWCGWGVVFFLCGGCVLRGCLFWVGECWGFCSGWCVGFDWLVFVLGGGLGCLSYVSCVCFSCEGGGGYVCGCGLGLWLWCTCFLFLEVFVSFGRGVLPGSGSVVSGGLLSGGFSGSSVGMWVPGVVGVLPGSGSVSGLLGGSSGVGVDGSLVFGLGVGVGWGGCAPVVEGVGFGGFGVGGGFVEGLWGSGAGFEGVVDESLSGLSVGGSVLPGGGVSGFGVVSGSGVRFGSQVGFGGSGVSGWDGFLGSLGCSAVGVAGSVGGCVLVGDGVSVVGGGLDVSDVPGVGAGGALFGSVSGVLPSGGVSVRSVGVPWFGGRVGAVGGGVLSGVVPLVLGLPVVWGVGVDGGLSVGWGLSSASLGVLGGGGFAGGSGLGRGVGVWGVGAAGFVPGVSGVVGSVAGFDGGVEGSVVGSGVGAEVVVDGVLWRGLVFGSLLVPVGVEDVSGSGGVVLGVSSLGVSGCVGGLSGVYGGSVVSGGGVGSRVMGLSGALSVGGLGDVLSGVGGSLGLVGVSPVASRVDLLGAGFGVWGLVEAGLGRVRGFVGDVLLGSVVGSVRGSAGSGDGVGGSLGLGFVAGSEGFGSPVGVVNGGGVSGGLFGRSGFGVSGGWVDVPSGSPVLGLGVSVGDVLGVVGG